MTDYNYHHNHHNPRPPRKYRGHCSSDCDRCDNYKHGSPYSKECYQANYRPQLDLINGGCSLLWDDGTGKKKVIDFSCKTGALVSVCQDGSVIRFTDDTGYGYEFDICQIIGEECPTTVVLNPDGSVTITGTDGIPVNIPKPPVAKFTLNDEGYLVLDNGATGDDAQTLVVDVCDAMEKRACFNIEQTGPTEYLFTYPGGEFTLDINEIDFDVNEVYTAGSKLTFVAENGTKVEVDVCQLVAENCNATFTINPDGSATFTDNQGNTTQVPAAPVASVVDNGDGTFTFSDGAGNDTVVDVCDMVAQNCNPSIVINPDGSATFTDVAGGTTEIPAPAKETLVDNGDGSFTFTDADGNVVEIPAPPKETLVDNGDGSFTFTHADGNVTEVPAPPKETITDNGNGTFTFTDANGNEVVIDVCDAVGQNCNPTLTLNPDGSATFTDVLGSTTDLPAPPTASIADNGDGTLTFSDGAGNDTVVNVCEMVAANCSDSSTVSPEGVFTHTAIDGAETTFDFGALIQQVVDQAIAAHPGADGYSEVTLNDGTIDLTGTLAEGMPIGAKLLTTYNDDGSVRSATCLQETVFDEKRTKVGPSSYLLSSLALNQVITQAPVLNIQVPPGGGQVRIAETQGLDLLNGSPTGAGIERLSTATQYSLDGGATWVDLPGGGYDIITHVTTTGQQYVDGEHDFSDEVTLSLPAGSYDITVRRIVAEVPPNFGGRVSASAMTFDVGLVGLTC